MNKQIEEKRELVDILYWSGYGFDRGTCNDLARQIYEQGYRRQDEVAREILTQLEEEIKPLLEKNYRLYTKYLNEQDSQTVLRFGGKIDALRGIYCFIEELKKKYGVTEDESES